MLSGPKTWISLPRDLWPKEWIGVYNSPVVILRLALYGHPSSGYFWEKHADAEITAVGFEAIPEWPSCYWHLGLTEATPNGVR